ncbi:MAG: winged helix-turn-helix domain-containing protein [Desulfobacteraceae bacterium]|nr:MAG: winged helix-turn-helix domain-containing protein [Desulfobacteraceae bacterium]
MSHHIKKDYNFEIKVRQCQNLLFKQLGFSLQRPREMPNGGDPEKQAAFKKILNDLLSNESCELLFYDEHFHILP